MDFSEALVFLKDGEKLARKNWNGEGMYIEMFVPKNKPASQRLYEEIPYIRMRTVDFKLVPWLASQTDLLSEDWVVVY